MPDVRLPRAVRGPVLAAAPVLFAVWALAGLYGALGPAFVRRLTGSASEVLGGLSLTTLTVTAVSSVYLLRNVAARTVMLAGIIALVAGVAITLAALAAGSPALFFAGTAVSGIGFGAGFQGGIRTVVPQAAPHERAGLLSVLFTSPTWAWACPPWVPASAPRRARPARRGPGLRHRADRPRGTRPGGPAPDPSRRAGVKPRSVRQIDFDLPDGDAGRDRGGRPYDCKVDRTV